MTDGCRDVLDGKIMARAQRFNKPASVNFRSKMTLPRRSSLHRNYGAPIETWRHGYLESVRDHAQSASRIRSLHLHVLLTRLSSTPEPLDAHLLA
jgi:hypothetical protein